MGHYGAVWGNAWVGEEEEGARGKHGHSLYCGFQKKDPGVAV